MDPSRIRSMDKLILVLICIVFTFSKAYDYDASSSYFKTAENTTFNKLTLWIAGSEIEHFVGFPMDIFVVLDGKVLPFLQDAVYDAQLPILPPEINSVVISWMGPDDVYHYKFPDFRSLDPNVMHNPLLNIKKWGTIPQKRETFTISIPCTGLKTGIASMYLSLDIVDSSGRNIQGSPLKLLIRKRCIAYAESTTGCEDKCKNGGLCENGRCLCKQGYHGMYCQFAACLPACVNNGTCIRPGKCICPRGYRGDRCERVRCKSNCSDRGECLEPNKCTCPPEYYGKHCEFESGICEPPCQNGGTCTTPNVCECLPGYEGPACNIPLCKRPCVNGECISRNQCECQRGWRGRWCHKKAVNRMGDYRRRRLRHARQDRFRRTRERDPVRWL